MSLDARLQRLWYGPAWRSVPLWPLALSFRGLLALRGALYRVGLLRTHRVDVPVIVVGNVTVGGTGKTPVAAWVAAQLGARGRRVGVILRGYGGMHRGGPRVVAPGDDPAVVGDEAVLHARRGAHVVVIGADRVAAARKAAADGAEVVVCDDGLQHRRLGRDYEIVVVDGERGLGNRWLLPAGPLREPAARLERVNAVILTERGADRARPFDLRGPLQFPARLRLGEAVNLVSAERRPLESFTTLEQVHAIAGVGNPEAFFAAVRAAGVDCVSHALPDHAPFAPAALGIRPGTTVLMTEKDAVKCRTVAEPTWWWVDLAVEIDRSTAGTLLGSIHERTGLSGAGAFLG